MPLMYQEKIPQPGVFSILPDHSEDCWFTVLIYGTAISGDRSKGEGDRSVAQM